VHGEETLLLAFNLSADPVRVSLPVGDWQMVQVPGPDAGEVVGSELVLPAQSMYCARRG